MKWSLILEVLVGALFVAVIDANFKFGCLGEDEPLERVKKVLHAWRRHEMSKLSEDASSKTASCAEFQHHIYPANVQHRSLSPWTITQKTDHSLIPSTYSEARCLCEGCIINGSENTDYNSVPVKQTRLFLRKKPCPNDPTKYTAEVEYISVPVACTCALPKQIQHRV